MILTPYIVRLSHPLARLFARCEVSRRPLNFLYSRLSSTNKMRVHRYYAKIFDAESRAIHVDPGFWAVSFSGRRIKIPLGRARFWLDWDIALSIIGHDNEVKLTYEYFLCEDSVRPQLFVDVGANYGTHTLLFNVNGVETLSFEPNPRCREVFLDLCAANSVKSEFLEVAIGELETQMALTFPVAQTWLGTLSADIAPPTGGRAADIEKIDVPVAPLDDYIDRMRGLRVLIKLDVEGHEIKALMGMCNILREIRPWVIFECKELHRKAPIFDFLSARQYNVASLPFRSNLESRTHSIESFCEDTSENFVAMPIN